VLIFAAELLSNAEVLISKGLHQSDVIAGYTKASEKAQQILEGTRLCLWKKTLWSVSEYFLRSFFQQRSFAIR
jgi:hypothetical protein